MNNSMAIGSVNGILNLSTIFSFKFNSYVTPRVQQALDNTSKNATYLHT